MAEMDSFRVDLGDGVEFSYHGPQTARRIYCGTVGPTPEFNGKVIDRLMRDRHLGEPGDWQGMESSLTSIATTASPWALIQFDERRLPWLIARLREVVRDP